MVDDLNVKLGRIDRNQVPRIRIRRQSGYEPWLDEFCKAAFLHYQVVYHHWR